MNLHMQHSTIGADGSAVSHGLFFTAIVRSPVVMGRVPKASTALSR
jgi:hypothetical protein